MNISSIVGSIGGKISPFMTYIKIAAIVIVVSTITGLYAWGHHLSGKVADLTKENGTLTEKLKVAKDANDSEEAAITALTGANDTWAKLHRNDQERLAILTARASDLSNSLDKQRSELAKHQLEDSHHDTQNVLSIDLNVALPDLAQRLRDEQRALYQDGDQRGAGSCCYPSGQKTLPALSTITEDSGQWCTSSWGRPASDRGLNANASELQQASGQFSDSVGS